LKKFIPVVLVIVVVLALILGGCSNTPTSTAPTSPAPTSAAPTSAAPTSASPVAAATKTLKIGALFGLTGFFSEQDQMQLQEVEVVSNMINAAGGVTVKGEKYNIEVVSYDFKSTMDGVAAGANQLVYKDQVKFMIAPSAFFSPPTKDVTEPNKVLRMLTWILGTPQELGPDMPYTFLPRDAHPDEFRADVKFLKENYPNVKTIAYLFPDDGCQNDIYPKDKKILEDAGYTVVGDLNLHALETTDFSPIASKLVSLKTDAIIHAAGTTMHTGSLLKAIRQLGSDTLLLHAGDSNPADVVTIAGAAYANNFISPGLYKEAPNMTPLMKEIQDKVFAKAGGEKTLRLQAVNDLYAFVQGIQAANSLDTTDVKNALEKMDSIQTPYGTARKGGQATFGINHAFSHPNQVWTLVNGKPVFGGWVDNGPLP
jgi:branched-chain amino acid transport system substrate-binding protein